MSDLDHAPYLIEFVRNDDNVVQTRGVVYGIRGQREVNDAVGPLLAELGWTMVTRPIHSQNSLVNFLESFARGRRFLIEKRRKSTT